MNKPLIITALIVVLLLIGGVTTASLLADHKSNPGLPGLSGISTITDNDQPAEIESDDSHISTANAVKGDEMAQEGLSEIVADTNNTFSKAEWIREIDDSAQEESETATFAMG